MGPPVGTGEAESGRLVAAVARALVRRRVALVGFWVFAALAASLLLPSVRQAGTGSLGDLVANDAEAIDAEVRSVELFRFPVLSRTVVIERDPDRLSPDAVRDIYRRSGRITLGELSDLRGIAFALTATDVGLPRALSGGAHAALTYLFYPQEIGPVGRTGLAERLVDRYVRTERPRQTGITGAVPARGEQIRAIRDALPLVELATVALIALVVGLHFRSVLAPVANVTTVALSYIVAVRLVGGAGQAVGIAVPEEVEPVMVALLFGIVTDYFIFFLSRFRGLLNEGLDAAEAAERTAASLLPIILTAGISVAAASAGLVVAQLGFFQAFGPGLAVTVLIALAVVVTLVPALMALLGDRLLWPGRPVPEGGAAEEHETASGPTDIGDHGGASLRSLGRRAIEVMRDARAAMLALPIRRPWVTAVAVTVPLMGLALFLPRLELANTLISGLPRDSPPKSAAALASADFPEGAISPTMLLVEHPGIASERAALNRFQRSLEGRRNFADVIGPADTVEPAGLGATVSPTGDAVRYFIVFKVDPLGSRAIRTLTRLRKDLPRLLDDAGLEGVTASLAGDTAISEETVRKTEADLSRVIPVVALIVLAILVVFLRALIAPLYLLAASLLALGASLGLTVLVFQQLLGFGELTFYVPFAGTVLLVALGSDYNVYLAGRVWAEARSRPLPDAVRVASARATAAITVAALVLALSFALLGIVPLRPLRELAFLLTAGLLIDAFIVRTLLVPALITIVGERGGWPGGGLRRIETVGDAG